MIFVIFFHDLSENDSSRRHTSVYSHKALFIKSHIFFISKLPQNGPARSAYRSVEIRTYSGSLDPSRNSGKTNTYFFNIFAFWPHQPPTYTHHNCHLISSGLFFFRLRMYFYIIFLNWFHVCLKKNPSHEASNPRGLELPRRESVIFLDVRGFWSMFIFFF